MLWPLNLTSYISVKHWGLPMPRDAPKDEFAQWADKHLGGEAMYRNAAAWP